MQPQGIWMETRTGKRFRPLNPDPATVDVRDVAASLGNLCRFTGHTRRFYSVAQHSVLCSLAVEWLLLHRGVGVAFGTLRTLKLAALLHDAHEAYVGDTSAPMKAAIRHRAALQGDSFDPHATVCDGVEAAVRTAFKLPPIGATVTVRQLATGELVQMDVWEFIHELDMALLWREKFDLMTDLDWTDTPKSEHVPPPKIAPWVPDVATHRFLLLYKDLTAPHSRLRRFKPRLNWYDNLYLEFCALGRGRLTKAIVDRICPENMK